MKKMILGILVPCSVLVTNLHASSGVSPDMRTQIDMFHQMLLVAQSETDCTKLANYSGQIHIFGKMLAAVAKSSPKLYPGIVAEHAKAIAQSGASARLFSSDRLCTPDVDLALNALKEIQKELKI